MKNKLLMLLIVACLAQNSESFSNDNKQVRKSLEQPGEASMSSYTITRANFIEKPFCLTGDTIHQRRVLNCELPHDEIDYFDDHIIVYRYRIGVSPDYCYLPFLHNRKDLPHHVSAQNYLQLPDNLQVPDRILTKTEYQIILSAALTYSREYPDNSYKPCDIAEVQRSANGNKTVYEV